MRCAGFPSQADTSNVGPLEDVDCSKTLSGFFTRILGAIRCGLVREYGIEMRDYRIHPLGRAPQECPSMLQINLPGKFLGRA